MPEDNPPYVTVRKWPAGYIYVMVCWNVTQDGYTIVKTGPKPYRIKRKAVKDAKQWADTLKLEYRP